MSSNPNLTPTSSAALDKSAEWFVFIYLAQHCEGKAMLTKRSMTAACACAPHTFTVASTTISSLDLNIDFFIMNIKAGIKPKHMALYGRAVFIKLPCTASV